MVPSLGSATAMTSIAEPNEDVNLNGGDALFAPSGLIPGSGSPAPARSIRGEDGGGEAAPRLETRENKVTFHEERCLCRVCQSCGVGQGIKTRERLLERASLFSRPLLLTMTVDRRNFAGPEQAYEYVRRRKFIARMMRSLKIRHWYWGLEFQQRSGDGWPHWHILADVSHLPGERPVDFKHLWALWRDKWGIGGVDVSSADMRKIRTASHAINYVTKYLTKPTPAVPQWFLPLSRCRLMGASRSLGCVGSDNRHQGQGRGRRVYGAARPYLERLAECRLRLKMLLWSIDTGTGEVMRASLGTAPGTHLLASVSGGAAATAIFSDYATPEGTPRGVAAVEIPADRLDEILRGLSRFDDELSDIVTSREIGLWFGWQFRSKSVSFAPSDAESLARWRREKPEYLRRDVLRTSGQSTAESSSPRWALSPCVTRQASSDAEDGAPYVPPKDRQRTTRDKLLRARPGRRYLRGELLRSECGKTMRKALDCFGGRVLQFVPDQAL